MPIHAAQRAEAAAPAGGCDLQAALLHVEQRLAGLQTALAAHDLAGIESHAAALHQALTHVLERFADAARHGGVPTGLRQRLGLVGAQVAAQRDATARAATALERAIDVLMPDAGDTLYSRSGNSPPRRGGVSALQA